MPTDAAFNFVTPLFKLCYRLLAEPFFQCNTAVACCISGTIARCARSEQASISSPQIGLALLVLQSNQET